MKMLCLYLMFLSFFVSHSELLPTPISTANTTTEQGEEILGETRRILSGREIVDSRPYMVYLRPTISVNTLDDKNWLCGGVIIHERFILTSAACIEDVKYFYVVSGTHMWLPVSETSKCIENGAMRAVWKCVQKSYRFDGRVFNNIRWMVNDIAVVMLEETISFTRRVKGCQFIPQKIRYNNISEEFEHPGRRGFIAGWGSQDKYTDVADIIERTSVNSPVLMEAETIIITKETCLSYWLRRYHEIIEKHMICGKKAQSEKISENCREHHAECRKLVMSDEEGPRVRRFESNPEKLLLESAAQVRRRRKNSFMSRRQFGESTRWGGFCENDHGGPLVIGRGATALVVGIMTAYRVQNNSKDCHGPYLFTSVYKNRQLIHCAIYREEGIECPVVLRDQAGIIEEETFDWGNFTVRARAIYEDDDDNPGPLSTSEYTQRMDESTKWRPGSDTS